MFRLERIITRPTLEETLKIKYSGIGYNEISFFTITLCSVSYFMHVASVMN